MAKFHFEDYRQPWETGPHWELKREFIEKYQNDFDEDRLLCLAQAYSNIELMNCRYPDPVMWQVNELSKSLNGCRRFREANKILEPERNDTKNKGKRTLADEHTNKSYKFGKFCSTSTSNEIMSEELLTSNRGAVIEPMHQSLSKHSENQASYQSSNEKNSEIFDLNFIKSEEFADSKVMNQKNIKIADDSNPIFQISNSQDIKLLEKISCALKEKHHKSSSEVLENVIDELNMQGDITYKLQKIGNIFYCKFYISSTFVSLGTGGSEKNARMRAAEYGAEVLYNLSDLPCTSLSNLTDIWTQQKLKFKHNEEEVTKKSDLNVNVAEKINPLLVLSSEEKTSNKTDSDNNSLYFWLRFAEEVKKHVGKDLLGTEVIKAAGDTLKCSNKIFYLYLNEELQSSLGRRRIFFCDLVIENITICQGRGTNKKKARGNAAENGVLSFLNLIDWYKGSLKSNEDELSNKPAPFVIGVSVKISNTQLVRNNIINKYKMSLEGETLGINASNNSISSSVCEKNTKQDSFILNKTLLDNSYQRQFVLFDTSAVRSVHQQTPLAKLNYSATMCNKTMKYLVEKIPSTSGKPGCWRGYFILDGEKIGTADAPSEKETKICASFSAYEHLRKLVYTVKVKRELEDKLVISRSEIMDGSVIGKASGVTEPIVAFQDQKKGMNDFTQNVEALLNDFSQGFTKREMFFSTEISKRETKEIERIANKYNLISQRKGKSKQLCLKRKFSVAKLLDGLVRAGGSTSKYELFDDSSK